MYKESSWNALDVCSYKQWIRGYGVYEISLALHAKFLKQMLYFDDDYSIYYVTIHGSFEMTS